MLLDTTSHNLVYYVPASDLYIQIDVLDPVHAELLENHIATRDMFAFVCEDVDDNHK